MEIDEIPLPLTKDDSNTNDAEHDNDDWIDLSDSPQAGNYVLPTNLFAGEEVVRMYDEM